MSPLTLSVTVTFLIRFKQQLDFKGLKLWLSAESEERNTCGLNRCAVPVINPCSNGVMSGHVTEVEWFMTKVKKKEKQKIETNRNSPIVVLFFNAS